MTDSIDDLAAELGWAISDANDAEAAGKPEAPQLRAIADRKRVEFLKAAELAAANRGRVTG